ncbi:MAG: (2Fe-2S)-binding protein [Pseudomonadales bacterium]|nr:(2Fe-2S)-binding protein [Pseudomonadales bacterium]
MAQFSLTVNGVPHRVEADEATPLLYVLRNMIGLDGPRYGCGAEQCGACTVLVNGEPRHACTVPIDQLAAASVVTVEGLARDGHPLIEAFLAHNAAQCGYCSSGILVEAASLLAANPTPTRAEVMRALDGHLCRCGAHNRVIKAVLSVSSPEKP